MAEIENPSKRGAFFYPAALSFSLRIDNAAGFCYNVCMVNKGKFIVFEGTDGSGKSTQMKLLAQYLTEKGIACRCTREPTDSPFGTLLRSCMHKETETNEQTIAALFAADRLDHIQNAACGMEKDIADGVSVLCDRYYFSSLAYNGGFVSYEWVFELNRPAMERLAPDVVIFLDVDPEEGMRRVSRRGERDRYEQLEMQRRIRARYLETFARFPSQRVEIVSSREDKNETQAQVRRIADGLYGL